MYPNKIVHFEVQLVGPSICEASQPLTIQSVDPVLMEYHVQLSVLYFNSKTTVCKSEHWPDTIMIWKIAKGVLNPNYMCTQTHTHTLWAEGTRDFAFPEIILLSYFLKYFLREIYRRKWSCKLYCCFWIKSFETLNYRSCRSLEQLDTIKGFVLMLNEDELGHEKMCLTCMSYANNKGADQPAHPRSLISAFVVRCLDSIISLDSIAKISRL